MKKILLASAALVGSATIAYAGGYWVDFPGLGTSANSVCTSYGNNGVCNQYKQAGPSYLTGQEQMPADTYGSQGQGMQTITIPTAYFAGGYGNATVSSTTGTTALVQVADNIGTFIYTGAGTATYTSFKFPANPMNNQKFCLANAGSGVLTLTAVAAGTNVYGNTPTVTGVTPTSLPVMTAVGTAGTVTLGTNCWLYQAGASNTGVWYRVQ